MLEALEDDVVHGDLQEVRSSGFEVHSFGASFWFHFGSASCIASQMSYT